MKNNNERFCILRDTYYDKIITPKKNYDVFLDFVKDYYQPEEITKEESVYNATYKKKKGFRLSYIIMVSTFKPSRLR